MKSAEFLRRTSLDEAEGFVCLLLDMCNFRHSSASSDRGRLSKINY